MELVYGRRRSRLDAGTPDAGRADDPDVDGAAYLREWLEMGAARVRTLSERLEAPDADVGSVARDLERLSDELWAAARGAEIEAGTEPIRIDPGRSDRTAA